MITELTTHEQVRALAAAVPGGATLAQRAHYPDNNAANLTGIAALHGAGWSGRRPEPARVQCWESVAEEYTRVVAGWGTP